MSGTMYARCQFCDSPSDYFCNWPEEKPVNVMHGRLTMEDVIVTNGGKRLKPQVVTRFAMWRERRFTYQKPKKFTITMYGLNYGKDKCFLFYRFGTAKVRVLRTLNCAARCCELHVRELGGNKHVCKAHWDSWQELLRGVAA